MHDAAVILDNIVVFVVIRPTGDNYRAAGFVECRDSCELVRGVDLGVGLSSSKTAGGSGEDERLELGVGAGSYEILGGLEHNGANAVSCRKIGEVAHGVLVVAGDILVVVSRVDAEIHKVFRVENIQLYVLAEAVVLAVLLQVDGHGYLGDLSDRRSVLESDGVGRTLFYDYCVLAVVDVGANDIAAVGGVNDGGYLCVACLAVEYGGGELKFLAGDGRGGAALKGGYAELEAFADPNGSGYCEIAVCLSYADEVVAVLGLELNGEVAACKICGICPSVGNLAGVYDYLDLAYRVGAVRIIDGNIDVELFGYLGNLAAEGKIVNGVVNFEVFILGGVNAHIADGLINACLAEIVGENDIAGIVCVAPLTLVVILVVGRCEVPALVERENVLLVAGVVAARAYLTFAVARLNEVHAAVDDRIPV